MKGGTLKDPKILIFFIVFVLGAPVGMAIGMILKFQAEKPIEDQHIHKMHDDKLMIHDNEFTILDNSEIIKPNGKPISALVIIIL